MGGKVFNNVELLDNQKYNEIIDFIKKIGLIENIDYVLPFRLSNKNIYNDIDIILADSDKFIKLFNTATNNISNYKIIDIKHIHLFERFNYYSSHLLTIEKYQIDLLRSYNKESIEITRAFYSYSFANIFLKKFVDLIHRNLKLSFLGILCSSNKFKIPSNVKFIQIDNSTRLIIDCEYIFNLIDLDYSRYKEGFINEQELLEYFKSSKYFTQIKFKNNSSFKHDYSRLKPFSNLVDNGNIYIENYLVI